jgi:ribosome maturation factor RimP
VPATQRLRTRTDWKVVDMASARGHARGRNARDSGRSPRATEEPRRVTGGPATGDLAAYKNRLREVIEPLAQSAGYDLEDLSVVRMGRRHVVRVTVDRDGGVGLDAVAELSRDISHGLDEAESAAGEFIAGEYQLEVSSPGTDRPLTEPRHWRRNVGRLVTVRLGGHPVTGRLIAADDDGATLSVDGAESAHSYADLGRGRIEVEFNRLDEVDDDDMVDFGESELGDGDSGDGDTTDNDTHDGRADVVGLDDDDVSDADIDDEEDVR